ncbi:MAG: hypothetical protein MN733_04230 [Nitrososphaera sp.]|nr:hypothetical protein [Nitrososphaera sp.]
MKLSGMVAHLLHSFKAGIAFAAHVQALLMVDLLVLHQVLYFAEFPATRFTLMFPEQPLLASAVAIVPALSAKVAFDIPSRFWVVVEHAEPAVTDRTRVHFLVVVVILFRVAGFAYKQTRLHLPLPLWFVPISVGGYFFATNGTSVWRLLCQLIPQHEFLGFIDVAGRTQQSLHIPSFIRAVFVPPKLPVADCAVLRLLFSENYAQARNLFARSGTKTYFGVECTPNVRSGGTMIARK